MNRPKIAFVVQRCGEEVNGGAEALCLSVARAMSSLWDVTIITTCARDYMTWEDHYEPGESFIERVRLRRFRVDRTRDVRLFDDLSQQLIGQLGSAPLDEQERWMREQGPFSSELLQYLRTSKDEFEAFYFFTYLYATTYFGLPIVAEKAVLVPFAHDEWPIYCGMWNRLFSLPARFVFSSPEERALLQRRFPESSLEGDLIGVGIEYPREPLGWRFTTRFGITNRYAMYLGRVDESKNCGQLVAFFDQFKERFDREGSDLILLLVGRAAMEIPKRPWMRHIGFVDEQTKWDAIAGSEVVIMPSQLESLSLVLLEAWKLGRAVLVNARSDVLVGQCRRSQGGLWFDDADEFGVALRKIVYEYAEQLGANGRRFVEASYTWPAVIEAYQESLRVVRSGIRSEPGN